MGVPAFFRWLSEKYPKCIQDVLEERVPADASGRAAPHKLDWTKPNPNAQLYDPTTVECDALYVDMNGIIHPCAHPEEGAAPRTEPQMYAAVAAAVDRLCRVVRPRTTLYLAIDGVAPRAKMNQQRARRFRAAQEARELKALEEEIRVSDDMFDNNDSNKGDKGDSDGGPWDSNVITPGTPFMIGLATYMRFYVRQRLSGGDAAWKDLKVLFSDASVPGEGEHKIMSHVRLQRAQPGYNPNAVHVLHGLDADLIMLALATHEAHFYISREEVTFGRKSMEMQEHRQLESGYTDAQRRLDEAVGDLALQLPENRQKPLQRVSIPILREYLAAEFATVLNYNNNNNNGHHHHQAPNNNFAPTLERCIDDFVFLCFFVGNDFLPHLPSLDIRDGALDFLLNTYKAVVPTTGHLTSPGGNLNLSAVSVVLQHVGSIEDYVFQLKHENEQRREAEKARFRGKPKIKAPPADGTITVDLRYKTQGKAAKLLNQDRDAAAGPQALVNKQRGPLAMPKKKAIKPSAPSAPMDNAQAAQALKDSLQFLSSGVTKKDDEKEEEDKKEEADGDDAAAKTPKKEEEKSKDDDDDEKKTSSGSKRKAAAVVVDGVGQVGDAEAEFDVDDEDDDDEDDDEDKPPKLSDHQIAAAFKEKVKARQNQTLDEYAKNVVDNVRLHEPGWKDRYYSDKCKAEDVAEHGGKEHLFRTYVMGLVWVMKYYYDGCPSWKFYFPFHYAPFASDLQNIERFAKDVKSFQLGKPFNPVEQLMAVLPSDSSHAIPKAARWLMSDPESPIIEFYPKDVPCDPNGKAMPWLWVVLLPFIDEDALLSALHSTMPKWTKEELLCNARGLDDAYLYVHSSHPLCTKLATVLKKGRTAKDPKIKLNDAAAYGCGGFSGSLRPPLSNELYPIDEHDIKIPPPPDHDQIDEPLPDNLFLEEIDPNLAVCVSFSEPLKLPHKSILLPGAKPPPPVLTEEDKRIRRPRINRGGSIANMGASNGKSYQAGYGSMNISSYERELAEKTGRGRQMNQAGFRTWGSMEPTPKRPRVNANPFQQQQQQQHGQYQQQGQQGWGGGPPGYQQQPPQSYQGNQGRPPYGQPPRQYQQPPYQQQPSPGYQQPQQRPPYQQQRQPPYANNGNSNQSQGRRGPPCPPRHQQQQQHRPTQRPPYQQPPRGGPPPPPPRQGFSFNQAAAPAPAPAQQRSRTSANTMRSLREQLSSTLKQNKGSQG